MRPFGDQSSQSDLHWPARHVQAPSNGLTTTRWPDGCKSHLDYEDLARLPCIQRTNEIGFIFLFLVSFQAWCGNYYYDDTGRHTLHDEDFTSDNTNGLEAIALVNGGE
jgi:hypothetical protein